jgi:hypothetical protein
MRVMNLDNGLWISGVLIESILVGLLLYRRTWRTLPIFIGFCIWEALSGAAAYFIVRNAPNSYPFFYLVQSVVDATFEFAVLVELTWSVLRPIRNSLPPKTLLAIVAILLIIAAAIWPFSGLQAFVSLAPALARIAHVQQTTALLRVFFFLALAGCSQLLSIGWRDRELQVATGLGFVSLVSLGTAMLHTHQSTWVQYSHLNQVLVGSYLGSLVYWVVCFAQKEAERREFTPQMQNLLLAVAGVARAERTALTNASGGTGHPKE